MSTNPNRSEKLALRLTPTAKPKISQAAEAASCSVSDFALSSALARADETLAERQHFKLNAPTMGSIHSRA